MALNPPRSPAAASGAGPEALSGQPLSAAERARHEDQTVPYVGDLLPALLASEVAYPQISPGALKVVRALLDNSITDQRDSASVTRDHSRSEPPTLKFGGGAARSRSEHRSDLTEKHSVPVARSADHFVGRVIADRYTIESLLASGGMGRVYRAQQSSLGRTVAVKIFEARYASEPNASKRFFREAAIASKLRHPNTIRIFDYGVTDDNVCYIAMELLAGKTLRQVRRDAGPLTPERVAHIARQICRSLAEAHALGVVHRDLKPSNIHIEQHSGEPDFVKVLDFGLVKELAEESECLTATGLFMGSPHYSAPEQIRGEAVDARTDIYSLGVVMREMLTEDASFQQGGAFHILMAHLREPSPGIDTPIANHAGPELQAIVQKCLEQDPNQRYQTMDALHSALACVEGSRSKPPSSPPRSIASVAPAASTTSRPPPPHPHRSTKPAERSSMWILTLLGVLFVAGLLLALPSRIREGLIQPRGVHAVPAREARDRASSVHPRPSMNDRSEAVVPWSQSPDAEDLGFRRSATEVEASQ